jgi:succinate dehydrogenase/fumarate reductase flavoprotein subunit
MSQKVPAEILDALTRVNMPGKTPIREAESKIRIGNEEIPLFKCHTLIVGSGAAGTRAAVELKRRNVDVLVASTGLYSGTSACSGSDKQTLHTAGTSNNGDNFKKLAKDIGSGGCMDEDTAYIEATGSLNAFAGLQYMGLPLPQDRFGAVLRYKTDHDEVGRATSCGPRTSRLMVKVLAEEAIRLGVPFLQGTTVVKIFYKNNDRTQSISGVLATKRDEESNPHNLVYICCSKLVLATGGPGELYRDSVYPKNCYGSLGMAIEAGLEVTNLTESQFGIGTRREDFPWNLSGTYVQVIPYVYSVDEDGTEHNFLADYYRTTQEVASNIFRKGYQWPFHATRMSGYGSSLLDLAVFRESQKGRTIYLDFNRNPEAVPGDLSFSMERLDEDVYEYLKNNDALQELPIQRLLQMNPLAIELYKMHGTDITTTPLAFNVNNQHMNGGVNVNIWSQSSHEDIYAIGEVAGTHGVTRPGGAALNAGQVFGTRCAAHIANANTDIADTTIDDQVQGEIGSIIQTLEKVRTSESALALSQVKSEIQARMSDYAGFICQVDKINQAYEESKKLNREISKKGIRLSNNTRISEYFNCLQLATTSEAVLMALDHYGKSGGGSRGARAMCSERGTVVPEARNLDLGEYRYIEEKEDHKRKKIIIQKGANREFTLREVPIRSMEDPGIIFFEKNWANYLTNEIYKEGFAHR